MDWTRIRNFLPIPIQAFNRTKNTSRYLEMNLFTFSRMFPFPEILHKVFRITESRHKMSVLFLQNVCFIPTL